MRPRRFLGLDRRHAPGFWGHGCGWPCRYYYEEETLREDDLKDHLADLEEEIRIVKEALKERAKERSQSA